ncbi:MAG TPA: hypothetical protein VLW83_05420, partial [Candidatus Acidoferrales bacterium]|nr:hypothetical protein [Candidatus Acidoferrales bacterium]
MAINSKSLTHFLRPQVIYIFVAAVVAATFWAIGLQINPLTIIVYSLCIGNFISFPLERLSYFYRGRPFPYNWLIFLAFVLLLTPFVYVISSVIVWWIAPPAPQSLSHLILTGWKYPSLTIVVFSGLTFLYNST